MKLNKNQKELKEKIANNYGYSLEYQNATPAFYLGEKSDLTVIVYFPYGVNDLCRIIHIAADGKKTFSPVVFDTNTETYVAIKEQIKSFNEI